MLTSALIIGIVVSLLLTELVGLTAGGIIVPGYVALLLDRPAALAGFLLVAAVSYAIVRALGTVLMLYGTRRFAIAVLAGLTLSVGAQWVSPLFVSPYVEWVGLGLIVPGLLANQFDRQGVLADAADAGDRRAAGPAHSHSRGAAMTAARVPAPSPTPAPPSVSRWRPRPRIRLARLAAAAVLSVAAWLAVEFATHRPIHPRYAEMLAAARTMQAASRVLVAEKEARGLLQGRGADHAADPNRTGMIGPEYTAITTTLGDLAAKRTTTNPDFAAALVRIIATLDLARGAPVVIVLSGSFVGGNIAAIAAAEALGLRPVVVASLSASMWGANDPDVQLVGHDGGAARARRHPCPRRRGGARRRRRRRRQHGRSRCGGVARVGRPRRSALRPRRAPSPR